MTRVRKWLGYSIDFQITLGELLVIVALVILVNAIWSGVPAWMFVLTGVAVGAAQQTARYLWRWRRRRAADA